MGKDQQEPVTAVIPWVQEYIYPFLSSSEQGSMENHGIL